VQVLGNLKFAAATPGSASSEPLALGRPYVLAASTRNGEEMQILQAWRSAERGERLLVIAPRHPKRRDEIVGELGPLCTRLAVRSRGDRVDATTDVYLADTLGELERFMAGADLVFMGGSLVQKGGHNVLEPARLGRPLVFGPHMENFADEAQLLLAADAAVQVRDAAGLGQVITALLADESRRTALEASARAAVAAQADVVIHYLDALERLCPPAPSHVEARA
jgi:3-deoxy-D-manno-octulosonic-acid transferase